MKRDKRQYGFSLTEVLIAAGILAIGLTLIAMAFPVGVKLTSITAEQVIAAAAADEAAAKMRLYGVVPFTNSIWPSESADPNACTTCTNYQEVSAIVLEPNEVYYPSVVSLEEKRYCWSVLLRRIDPYANAIQPMVFICRVTENGTYYTVDNDRTSDTYGEVNGKKTVGAGGMPVPVKVKVQKINDTDYPDRVLKIIPASTSTPIEYGFFTAGCVIVEDSTGNRCRVADRKFRDGDNYLDLILQEDYPGPGTTADYVWVVPPGVGSSRNPCISVEQIEPIYP